MNTKRKKIIKMICLILAVAIVLATITTFSVLLYRVPIVYDIEGIKPIDNNVLKLSKEDNRNSTGQTALLKMKEGVPSDEDFKILFFSDLHLNESKKEVTKTVDYFVKTIQAESPDLVIIAGDIIVGNSNHKRIRQFNEIMDKLRVYWAPVLGNHEGDSFLLMSREKTVEAWSSSQYCLMESDVKYTKSGERVAGHGNYVFSILNNEYSITRTFVMLDGGDRISRKERKELNTPAWSYDFIKTSQIDWYKEVIDDVKSKTNIDVESMLCVHIPIPEYATAIEFDRKNLGIIQVNEGWELVYGVAREKVSCSAHNSGMYDALVEKGTRFVFSGHDHVNDYVVKNIKDDIYLTFIRNGSYSTYDIITRGYTTDENDRMQGYNIMYITNEGRVEFNSKRYVDDFVERVFLD